MRRRAAAAIAILLGVALGGAHEWVLLAVGDALVIRDELVPADVIHVISGPDHRTDHAIQLYQQGYGRRMFFTGGWCPEIEGNHAERGRDRAVEQGVPEQAVAIDGSWVTSTYSEALRLKAFLDGAEQPGIRSVIVVSDAHHLRRARWAYRQVLGAEIELQMAAVPFEQSPFRRRWWTDAASRQFVWGEYRKIVYYHLRYRYSRGLFREWLASLDTE